MSSSHRAFGLLILSGLVYLLLMISPHAVVSGDDLSGIALRTLPDLRIPSFTVTPSQVTPGDILTVAITVKNKSIASAPASYVALFATGADATDLLNAAGPVVLNGGPLGPGASKTLTLSFTVPAVAPGSYALWAKADPDHQIAESREYNNDSVARTLVIVSPSPTPTATFFVAPNGSDSNPGSETLPFRTISYGVSRLAPGETLFVKQGTYAESLDDNIPAGTSWSQPVTVAAYPGHTVILRPPPGAEFVLHFQGPQAYIVINGLILDGTNVTYDVVKITQTSDETPPAHHIRLQNCEVMNSPHGHGILIADGDGYNEILSCSIHHNGNQYDGGSANHGIYVHGNYNLIEGNEIYENRLGYGVHLFNGMQSFNVIRRNLIHDNGDAMDIHGNGNVVALNLIWDCGIGINLGPSGSVQGGNEIVQNTIYRCEAGVAVREGVPAAKILNNIVQASSGYPSNSIIDGGINTQIEHNVLDRSVYNSDYSVPPAGTNQYNTNALFVNPAAFDFHLQSGSPAIGAGMDIPEVPTDFDGFAWGNPRSSGAFR